MMKKGLSASALARAVWGETKDPRGYMVAKGRDRISAYMAGVSYPDTMNRAKIAAALGIDPDVLNAEPAASSPRATQPAPPDISLSIIAGEPDIAALTFNHKIMPTELALKILTLIREAESGKPEPAPAPAPLVAASKPVFSLLTPSEPAPSTPTPSDKKRRR
jgi:hypothetical protein